MVQITKKQNLFIIDVLGFHKLWTLKHQLRIPVADVVNVYQNQQELEQFKGIRFGTYIPFLITVGTYAWKGKRNFWDVTNKKNTLIIELKNNSYSKLYLDVQNPTETINLLKTN